MLFQTDAQGRDTRQVGKISFRTELSINLTQSRQSSYDWSRLEVEDAQAISV